jgi:alanine racemase
MIKSSTALLSLTVDVDAVVSNWRLIRERVAPARVAAVVKADAYGLGVRAIAPALAAAGCRVFFVATLDEGLVLRSLVEEADIVVLSGPVAGTEDAFQAARLVPTINSLEQLGLWRNLARRLELPLTMVLHVDTGMTRLGLEAGEIDRLIDDPDLMAGVGPMLILSHLACADTPAHPLNARQRERFRKIVGRLSARPPGSLAARSLAASSGVFLGPAYHFDLLRPGAALYGVNPTPGQPNPMAPVVRLSGRVLQVRDVDSTMTVGYGATHQMAGPGRVATVAVGYADGWFRALANRGHGVIDGKQVPVVGRISMDLTTFDVSAIPPERVRPGMMLDLIGPGYTVDDVAADAGTIGYEILTALGRRAERHYLGGVPV